MLGNALVGVRVALGELDEDPDSLVVAGHSAGGALAADYAAIARRTSLPVPRAVLSVYPGRAFRGIPFAIPAAGPVPEGVALRVLTGADDRVVDPRDAEAIHSRAASADRRLVTIRAPGASDHLGPQRDTAVSRAVFWRRLDAFDRTGAARSGGIDRLRSRAPAYRGQRVTKRDRHDLLRFDLA